MPVDDLFKNQPAKIPEAYWADLRRVLELEAAGKQRPAFPVLRDYLNAEHNLNLCWTTIRNHYNKVRTDAQNRQPRERQPARKRDQASRKAGKAAS